MDIIKELSVIESTKYELKEMLETKNPKSWLKTISAFANSYGGIIYFGVADDRTVVGITNIKETSERISELINDRIHPNAPFLLEIIEIDNKKILKVIIKSGKSTPYYYVADGNKVAFIRQGSSSIQAPPIILNELILKGQNLSFDAIQSRFTFDSLSFTLLKATYRQRTGNIMEDSDFLSFGLKYDELILTNAGVLLSDQTPLLQSRIFCTRWSGIDRSGSIFSDAHDAKEYSGNIISLLENGMQFVENNSKTKWRKTAQGRIEVSDYPKVAVYEALVNALIHRDYSLPGAEIHIDMYDNRLEIVSPGGMFDGKFIQDLDIMQISSIRRNPVICDMLHRLKYME